MPGESRRSDIAEEICRRVAEGASLASACRDAGVSSSAFRAWVRSDAALASRYADARADQADALADEIITIADTEPDAIRARVRVEARRWVAAKLRPQVYGDRVDLHVQGSVDLRAVLAGAEERRIRPACDQPEAIPVLDVSPARIEAGKASDSQSGDAEIEALMR